LLLGLQPVIHVATVLTTAREKKLIGSASDVLARTVVHHQHLRETVFFFDLLRSTT
jgi:hypothetical protein